MIKGLLNWKQTIQIFQLFKALQRMRRDFFLNKMNKMDGKMCSKCNDVNEDLVRLSPT